MGRNKDNCRKLLGELSDYLDGEASATACAEIEQHLAACDDCRIVVDTLRQTVYLYRELPQPALPGEVRERLYKAFNLRPRA